MAKKITILATVLVIAGIVVSIGAIASTQTGMIKKGAAQTVSTRSEYRATGASQGSVTASGTSVVLDSTPIGELIRFENDLKNILDGLQRKTGTVRITAPESLQNDWNTIIEKHKQSGAGVIVHPSGTTSPDNQYIQAKQRVEKTLKATVDALNKNLKK